jgi:hypothetical protein
MFALDGKTFGLKNLIVNFEREFKSKDMSGQSSATDHAEQGDKAARLSVSGLIAFQDIDRLKTLEAMSAARDSAGERLVYRIVDDVANAFKIRQVKFTGRFSAAQQVGIMAWQVSFHLQEYGSIAERKEQRRKAQPQTTPSQNTRLKQSLQDNQEAIA